MAAERLAERDGLCVSRETLRSWMLDAGLWLSRKQRRTFHQPRLRREAYGELVQIGRGAPTPHLLDKAAREVFGLSVKELTLERRLLEAKRLLMFTVRSVEDIGREIGFEDPAYFSRFFRKRTGEAPATWRRRHLRPEISPAAE